MPTKASDPLVASGVGVQPGRSTSDGGNRSGEPDGASSLGGDDASPEAGGDAGDDEDASGGSELGSEPSDAEPASDADLDLPVGADNDCAREAHPEVAPTQMRATVDNATPVRRMMLGRVTPVPRSTAGPFPAARARAARRPPVDC